jgi:hypothetical protein
LAWQWPRQTEVEQPRRHGGPVVARGPDEDVLRLEVAVNESALVRDVDQLHDGGGQPPEQICRQRSELLRHPLRQRRPGHVLEHQVRRAVLEMTAGPQERHRGRSDGGESHALERQSRGGRGLVTAGDLDRHPRAIGRSPRLEHRAEASLPE